MFEHMVEKKRYNTEEFKSLLDKYQKIFSDLKNEISKIVVGQDDIIEHLMEAILCNGHILIEGVPGIAKTLIIRALALITGGQFSRIQFTPDLLPTDIIGITTYEEGRGFYSVKGPVFANFVLADEINRAPPKVQSALLEAMQERQVTIGKESFSLPSPFFVMATQNPLESLGTYKLPEAQVDRFFYKVLMSYPDTEEEQEILHRNISLYNFQDFNINPILTPEKIIEAQRDVRKIYLNKKLEKYIIRIVDATRHPEKYNIPSGKYIDFGGSPRASISLFIASKVHALLEGRAYVTPDDVKKVAHPILRHRILLNYEGQAEEITTDQIIDDVLKKVPIE